MIRWLLAALLLAGCPQARPAYPHALSAASPRPMPLAALTGADGKPFSLASYQGKWVWLYFGYASCPDVCPTTLGKLADEYRRLKHPEKVQVLFVSVDPARDRPAAVGKAAVHYHPAFAGVVGDKPALDALTAALGTHYGTEAKGGVTHPDLVYVLDPQGRAVATYMPGAAIAEDFEQL
ncbi:MAG: electron transport protein SCO1/SenC [Cyanobacteria bacterium RYN_339]|nr:electron transport protein SCO1/SenC [Cyanobacteria bacterium RYN_339]